MGEIYQNEFAMVEVSRHETGSGPRLHRQPPPGPAALHARLPLVRLS
jgi:hypothetical protein